MPYIDKAERDYISLGGEPRNAGELNYKITTLIEEYRKEKGDKYQYFNDVMGTLSSFITDERLYPKDNKLYSKISYVIENYRKLGYAHNGSFTEVLMDLDQIVIDIKGALNGALFEFYRRVAAGYEDKKIIENGDVYDKPYHTPKYNTQEGIIVNGGGIHKEEVNILVIDELDELISVSIEALDYIKEREKLGHKTVDGLQAKLENAIDGAKKRLGMEIKKYVSE